jgi:hypothetical protein
MKKTIEYLCVKQSFADSGGFENVKIQECLDEIEQIRKVFEALSCHTCDCPKPDICKEGIDAIKILKEWPKQKGNK